MEVIKHLNRRGIVNYNRTYYDYYAGGYIIVIYSYKPYKTHVDRERAKSGTDGQRSL